MYDEGECILQHYPNKSLLSIVRKEEIEQSADNIHIDTISK